MLTKKRLLHILLITYKDQIPRSISKISCFAKNLLTAEKVLLLFFYFPFLIKRIYGFLSLKGFQEKFTLLSGCNTTVSHTTFNLYNTFQLLKRDAVII